MVNRAVVEPWLRDFQTSFSESIERFDGSAAFGTDRWDYHGEGGGLTRILTDGAHIEKAAVNFSAVGGDTPPGLGELSGTGSPWFYATGVSIIVHPATLTPPPSTPTSATSRPRGPPGSGAAPTSLPTTCIRQTPTTFIGFSAR